MQRSEYRNTILVMGSLGIATLTGFMRQSAIAYTLGAERAADIYLVAFAIPEFVFVALPIILTPVIIPLFAQIRLKSGETPAWSWGRQFSSWMLLLLLGITLMVGLAAPLLIVWLSPGFSASERQQAVQTLYRMLPGILLMGASVLVGSFLQVYRKFARPVLTTAVYNLVFIASLIFLPLSEPLYRAGWGVTLGAVAAMFFQLPLLWRVRPKEIYPTTIPGYDPQVTGEATRLTGWMAAGYGVHHLIVFIDRAMATILGAGSAAVINYGYHLALAAGQVGGLAVSTVIFPGLSEKVGAQELAEARRSISLALKLVWVLTLPTCLGLVLLRIPIVQVLLEHGAFSPGATVAVSTVVAIYALAVLADALCQPLWRVLYAQKNGKAVLGVNTLQTVSRVAFNLLLFRQFGYNGLALSALIGLTIQFAILLSLVRKSLAYFLSWRSLVVPGKILIAGIAAYGVTLAVRFLAGYLIQGKISYQPSPFVILITLGTLFLAIYIFLVIRVFRIYRLPEVNFHGK